MHANEPHRPTYPIVHTLAISLGQKWQKNIGRQKTIFATNEVTNMHPRFSFHLGGVGGREGVGVFGFFLFPMYSHQVLIVFPPSSQWVTKNVLQVLNVSSNMFFMFPMCSPTCFLIMFHFIPYPLPFKLYSCNL